MPTSGPGKSGHIKRVGTLSGGFCVVRYQFGTEKTGHIKRVGILTGGHIKRGLLYLRIQIFGLLKSLRKYGGGEVEKHPQERYFRMADPGFEPGFEPD